MCRGFHRSLPPDAPSFAELLAAVELCELSLALQWIGWAPGWVPPEAQRHDWRGEASRLLEGGPVVSAAPEVSVYIQTYQQLAYIRDAIDGVLAQRTPFELEIVIADDCSTDGTREVLAEYRDRHPDLIRLLLPERNLGPTEIFRRATAELRGRYVAWLDGDDYWTDPEKLVRQVEALQAQPDWAGCFHDATVRQVDGGAPDRAYVSDELRGPLGFADLLRSNPVPSLSVMARGELVRDLPRWTWEGLWADWLSLLAIAQHGDFGYLPEQMGVYRVHSAGISSGLSRAEQLEEDLRLYELLDGVVDERYRPDLERRGPLAPLPDRGRARRRPLLGRGGRPRLRGGSSDLPQRPAGLAAEDRRRRPLQPRRRRPRRQPRGAPGKDAARRRAGPSRASPTSRATSAGRRTAGGGTAPPARGRSLG